MDSYTQAHRRMAPLPEAAREFDIANNPHPAALFEAGSAGLQIWCTPTNNPGSPWDQVEMHAGAFAKPCEYVASVHWQWSEGDRPTVIGLVLSTDGYELERAGFVPKGEIHNRPEDITWAKAKLAWLWQASRADTVMPPIVVDEV
ncbi:MAG: hypothetical protein GKR89_35860 [Candidatus Latescibacteria bacterium]|nr:hypothetical protein [Candidatus Latescibacterota bacterium]